jgi:copper(I)-binding protein
MAGAGAIMITDGVGGQSVAAQLLIKEDETLDFETSHIWLELRDLKEPLKDGDMMPFDLIFRSGVLPGRAHAHAAAR